MKLKRQFALRRIADDILLVPIEQTTLDFDGMLTLNEVGAEIWQMLPEVSSEEEVVHRIQKCYDAPAEEIREDVADFFRQLRRFHIL